MAFKANGYPEHGTKLRNTKISNGITKWYGSITSDYL